MATANSILGQRFFSVDRVKQLRDALDRVVKRGTFDVVEKKRKRASGSSTKEMEIISFSSHLARASKALKTIQVTEEGDEIMDSDRISAARELISLSSRCDNMGRLASKAKQKGESVSTNLPRGFKNKKKHIFCPCNATCDNLISQIAPATQIHPVSTLQILRTRKQRRRNRAFGRAKVFCPYLSRTLWVFSAATKRCSTTLNSAKFWPNLERCPHPLQLRAARAFERL